MTIAASVISDVSIAYALLKFDCVIIDNKTSAPFSWTINTENYIDGIHTINITVVDEEGNRGFKETTVSINNSEKNTEMFSWVVTMVVGSIAIIAAIGVLVVVALLIRRRVMRKRGG
jgi:sorbitol-specific phosphotransferase system component IIBC